MIFLDEYKHGTIGDREKAVRKEPSAHTVQSNSLTNRNPSTRVMSIQTALIDGRSKCEQSYEKGVRIGQGSGKPATNIQRHTTIKASSKEQNVAIENASNTESAANTESILTSNIVLRTANVSTYSTAIYSATNTVNSSTNPSMKKQHQQTLIPKKLSLKNWTISYSVEEEASLSARISHSNSNMDINNEQLNDIYATSSFVTLNDTLSNVRNSNHELIKSPLSSQTLLKTDDNVSIDSSVKGFTRASSFTSSTSQSTSILKKRESREFNIDSNADGNGSVSGRSFADENDSNTSPNRKPAGILKKRSSLDDQYYIGSHSAESRSSLSKTARRNSLEGSAASTAAAGFDSGAGIGRAHHHHGILKQSSYEGRNIATYANNSENGNGSLQSPALCKNTTSITQPHGILKKRDSIPSLSREGAGIASARGSSYTPKYISQTALLGKTELNVASAIANATDLTSKNIGTNVSSGLTVNDHSLRPILRAGEVNPSTYRNIKSPKPILKKNYSLETDEIELKPILKGGSYNKSVSRQDSNNMVKANVCSKCGHGNYINNGTDTSTSFRTRMDNASRNNDNRACGDSKSAHMNSATKRDRSNVRDRSCVRDAYIYTKYPNKARALEDKSTSNKIRPNSPKSNTSSLLSIKLPAKGDKNSPRSTKYQSIDKSGTLRLANVSRKNEDYSTNTKHVMNSSAVINISNDSGYDNGKADDSIERDDDLIAVKETSGCGDANSYM